HLAVDVPYSNLSLTRGLRLYMLLVAWLQISIFMPPARRPCQFRISNDSISCFSLSTPTEPPQLQTTPHAHGSPPVIANQGRGGAHCPLLPVPLLSQWLLRLRERCFRPPPLVPLLLPPP
ncbi:unnamed protein product, partial [Ectocarpus sp. 13 AM-2016]